MKTFTKISVALLLAPVAYSSLALAAPAEEEGYYGVARVISAERKARNMDSSARPGIGSFVSGDDNQKDMTGSIGVGYRFGNGWRVEGELSLPQKDKFTSGSTTFPTSLNEHHIESRRVMLNAYRDFRVTEKLSVYGSAGLGLAQLESKGWQGNESRQYGSATQTNLAWSLGAGVAYDVTDRLALDLGYRYIDMGDTESGWNNFPNARGLQDEKMKANLVSSEVVLGMRWAF
ncbi:outer membrane protein [Pseudomonas chlororaphis]|uniref:outer membrane protein n=1 Tax=Pseudomonas chlororaphis TaxID=587753 RepID=UPI0019272851|nr:outer membrane protein [Pseudomonas chlororaphis]QQX56974.1 porin family protein [Pseudomonas chlororaphis subsp. aurantiaca]